MPICLSLLFYVREAMFMATDLKKTSASCYDTTPNMNNPRSFDTSFCWGQVGVLAGAGNLTGECLNEMIYFFARAQYEPLLTSM